MERPTSGVLRWVRALLLAVVVMTTGTVGHVAAEGLLPPGSVLAVLLGLCTIMCAGALGRPASRLRVVALTVLGQAGVHVVLSATAGHAGDPAPASTRIVPAPVTDVGRRTGSLYDHYVNNLPAAPAGDGADPVVHLVADLAAHAPMMAAHLVAAALVGLWLASGEQALWALLALTAGRVLHLVAPWVMFVPLRVPPVTAAPARHLAAPRLAALAPCVVRRGPPVLLAA